MLRLALPAAEEGTALLDTLAGCPSRLAGRVHGDILLNGQCLARRSLGNRVAYVRSERTLNPYLSVEQTLYFTNWLRQPGYQGAKTETKDRVSSNATTNCKLTARGLSKMLNLCDPFCVFRSRLWSRTWAWSRSGTLRCGR